MIIGINDILKPLIGAIIGYTTNWLAIKMLFKPHTEKRIGNFRIPFTPGIIPRERKRIAKSLGTAVGDKLLTETVISKELLNEKVLLQIESFVTDELLVEDISIKDMLDKLLGGESRVMVNKIIKLIVIELEEVVNSNDFLEGIKRNINGYIIDKYPYNTSLEKFLSSSVKENIEETLMVHKEKISDFIVKKSREQSIVEYIRKTIETLIVEKAGALGAMFIDPLDVTHTLLNYVEELVYEEETQINIVKALMQGIEDGSQMDLSQVLSIGQYEDITSQIANKITEDVVNIVKKIDMRKLIEPTLLGLLDKKIHLSKQEKNDIGIKIKDIYINFVEEHVGTFLKSFQLNEIVEEKVNTFEVSEVEDLIFAIIDKELKAITWFGALLGFVMGLVYIFI